MSTDSWLKRSLFHHLRMGLLMGAMSVIGLSGCDQAKGKQMTMPQRPPAVVSVATATTRDVPVYLDEIGKTVAVESVSIIPQVGGKIVATYIEDGATVKKGQLLFEIDPRPMKAALDAANASLAQSKAELELARVEFKRVQPLVSSAAVSQLEYDQKKSAVAVDETKMEAAAASVETAKLNLEYTKIYSPIDGRAGALLINTGNIVTANTNPLLVVQKLDPIYAEFTVTENDLGTVRKFIVVAGLNIGPEIHEGLKAQVDLPADSGPVLAALGTPTPTTQPGKNRGGPREGLLTFLDNTVQNGSGTVRLRATLPNSDHYFWPGQFVNVRLILTIAKDAVLVPSTAVQIGQQGPFVYVIKPDNTADIRPITQGQRQGDLLVIRSGVQPGEKVVISGQMMVNPGSKVVIANEGPNPVQPGAPTTTTANAGE